MNTGISGDWAYAEKHGTTVYLYLTISSELKTEGIIREIIRKIQNYRKACNLECSEKVKINLAFKDEEYQKIWLENQTRIADECLLLIGENNESWSL